ncbi:MAG: class III cytochrome C family protein [Rhodovulum sulfidophilum]|uniref:Class III cytochrome C family protein n=1 Tax=Rhodovulum sulfidophilum TaxID=35806 RepID=A0A2W5NCH6_RHOSU|nr:MAG: class III cytochrome C family protein [Rhodovulum sulfidophilum]
MKGLLAFLLLAGVTLAVFGSPLADPRARRTPLVPGGPAILPMTFAHDTHGTVGCVTCHHEFTDRDFRRTCLACHVTDAAVAPRLEEQFHALCRDCHATERAAGHPAGPTRRCDACHLPDARF